MYKVTVKTNSLDNSDNEVYLFNRLPMIVDKDNNYYNELNNQTIRDYESIGETREMPLPVIYIVGDEVKIYVYAEDSVEIGFE